VRGPLQQPTQELALQPQSLLTRSSGAGDNFDGQTKPAFSFRLPLSSLFLFSERVRGKRTGAERSEERCV